MSSAEYPQQHQINDLVLADDDLTHLAFQATVSLTELLHRLYITAGNVHGRAHLFRYVQ
jgi:hypothetical protein